MRLTLFDPEDLAVLETSLENALTRAFVKLLPADDGLLKALENTLARALVRAHRTTNGQRAHVERPRELTAAEINFETQLYAPEPPPQPSFLRPPPPSPWGQAPAVDPLVLRKREDHKRGRYRDLRSVCKVVATRPHGFIPREEAAGMLGHTASASALLSNWLLSGDVNAVIVADEKPPSKGLPGRLFVDKASLVARNARRLEFHANNPNHAKIRHLATQDEAHAS